MIDRVILMLGFLSLCLIVVLLLCPMTAAKAARDALKLWGLEIVPGVFPYMVLCRQLSAFMKHTRMNNACIPLCLGLLGGSPSGAAAIGELYSVHNHNRVEWLLALTGTISPVFLMHTVGPWMRDFAFGYKLICAHFTGAVLASIAVSVCRTLHFEVHSPKTVDMKDDEPIRDSVHAVLGIGGCIVFFSVISSVLIELLHTSTLTEAILHSVLEISGGLKKLSACNYIFTGKAVLSAALCGFSGFSILSQNLLFLKPLGIKMKHLFCFGLMRAMFSAMAMLLILWLFP